MGNSINIETFVDSYKKEVSRDMRKYEVLRDLDVFVLDNSIRESSVGQLFGHTLENKWQIYEEVKRCGFTNIVVAALSHVTCVDDVFVRQLMEKGEDRRGLFAFSEITESKKDRIPDTETVPIGLKKLKDLGFWNAILDVDLSDKAYDFDSFTMLDMCTLVKKWIQWVHMNLQEDAKVLVNLRDMSDVMAENPARAFCLVNYLARQPAEIRPFGVTIEEAKGIFQPEECGKWARYLRKIMALNHWPGKLLVHVHEKYGYADASQLECLMNGCDGTWGSICIEGAAFGQASTCVTLTNLIRFGNKKVQESYNCTYLRKAAIKITTITTGKKPYPIQPIYGERSLDDVFNMTKDPFDLADLFGEEKPQRITSQASEEMILQRLVKLFGDDPQFTTERAQEMKGLIMEDLQNNRKEEYMSLVGLIFLFDRAGGKITPSMAQAVSGQVMEKVVRA